jgi:hypothetical protein
MNGNLVDRDPPGPLDWSIPMVTGSPPDPSGLQSRAIPGSPKNGPQDVTRRLDGLRGWLAEIDRSLRRRSIIALVLTALAIGAGAAAIYISLTKNAESDRIDALETRIESLEAAAAGVATPEATTDESAGPALDESGTTPAPDESDVPVPPGTQAPQDGASGGISP